MVDSLFSGLSDNMARRAALLTWKDSHSLYPSLRIYQNLKPNGPDYQEHACLFSPQRGFKTESHD